MSNDHNSKPRKQIDDTRLRQGLFKEVAIDGGVKPERPGTDERTQKALPGTRSEPAARPATGYRNPPVETRFAKGQSGNPNGRPKGSGKSKVAEKAKPASLPSAPTLDEIRRRHLETPIRIRDGEGVRELHIIEALLRQIDKMAFGGGVQAGRLALQWHQETMRAVEAEYQDNLGWVADYRESYADKAAACDRAGEAVPDWIARPEDIHLSREKGLRIIGPCSPETLKHFLLLKRWRDAMHVKMIHDEAVFFWRPGTRVTLTVAELIVHGLDHLMPQRWKLASKAMRDREWELICLPRPQLARKLKEAFEPLGLKAPIRKPMGPMPDKLLRALKINPKQMRESFAKREAG